MLREVEELINGDIRAYALQDITNTIILFAERTGQTKQQATYEVIRGLINNLKCWEREEKSKTDYERR